MLDKKRFVSYLKQYKKTIITIITILLFLILVNYSFYFFFGQYFIIEEVVVPKATFQINETSVFEVKIKNIGLANLFFWHQISGGGWVSFEKVNCTGISQSSNWRELVSNVQRNEVVVYESCTVRFNELGQGYYSYNVCNPGLLFGKICGKSIRKEFTVE